MKVLFIGGTGVISGACTRLAAERGMEVCLLNRGRTAADLPPGVEVIAADVHDEAAVNQALAGRAFDAVANFIGFIPDDVRRDLRLFGGRVGQYFFVSSASVYLKPLPHYHITEQTPLGNPFWQYARDKIECEELLRAEHRERGFPVTIVRPSLTYGATTIPLSVNARGRPWSVVDRMLRGKPVVVHGDGTGLWTTTHNSDFAKGFVGLLGNAAAVGQAVHITIDEVLTWDEHYRIVAAAAGAREPTLVHVPSEMIGAWDPPRLGSLLGDKAWSAVFDNGRIKSLVPGYRATTGFREGIGATIRRFQDDPRLREIDGAFDRWCDDLIAAYGRAFRDARSGASSPSPSPSPP
jgi:nucleoside-diphosphate-sugar epimerase